MSSAQSPLRDDAAPALLEVITKLAEELYPGRKRRPPTLESNLERDLGIDSIARVELSLRLERRFETALPDQAVTGAETVRDLLAALEKAGRCVPAPEETPAVAVTPPDAGGGAPERASTLVEALEWHAERHPDRVHLLLHGQGSERETITYGALLRDAEATAGGLIAQDLTPGQPVGLMVPTSRAYFGAFFGILMAGGIPVPLYPPHRPSQIEDHARRQAAILVNAQTPILIVSEEVKKVGRILRGMAPDLRLTTTVAELANEKERDAKIRPKPDDTALLQYTSGSTGNPKGTILSHANLLANIRAMMEAARLDDSDVCVSWLPLYHDMGLIGAWLGSLYQGLRAILMSPLAFLSRPSRWLKTIHAERATASAAPNFAYDLCASKISNVELEGLDLSSWRIALNGAETVHEETIERFCTRFAPFGFRREAMMPVYGLAECSLGLAFPPVGRGPKVDRVRRDVFERKGIAEPAEADDPAPLKFVSCGKPIRDHEIRIVDGTGREVGEREHGKLHFRGPSATAGYYRNPEATRALLSGSWVDSGDCAYLAEGEVYLAGRAKDLIIRAGRNIYPSELEEAVGRLQGIRDGCVAVFGCEDRDAGTERLVVLAETREATPELQQRVEETIVDLLGVPADEVVLAPARTVLKTPSGKVRRGACRDLYVQGKVGASRPSVAAQMIRLAASSTIPRMRRLGKNLRTHLYALYVRVMFLLLAVFAWPPAVLLPGLRLRRGLVRLVCRTALLLAGVKVTVTGRGSLPGEGACVVAANHASYIDSLVLSAILPLRFGFVAKRELVGNFISRLFLRRLDALFVERFDPAGGSRDADVVTGAVRDGRAVVIFPEGTFGRAPGLRTFRLGAFTSAAQAGAPLVPVALRGTRAILRDDTWFPRRGAVAVSIGEPILPRSDTWEEALRLRNEARERILRACGEPDAGGEA